MSWWDIDRSQIMLFIARFIETNYIALVYNAKPVPKLKIVVDPVFIRSHLEVLPLSNFCYRASMIINERIDFIVIQASSILFLSLQSSVGKSVKSNDGNSDRKIPIRVAATICLNCMARSEVEKINFMKILTSLRLNSNCYPQQKVNVK